VKFTTVANHTNILLAAFVPLFFDKKLQRQNVSRGKLRKTLFSEKLFVKCWRKLTTVVNYNNIL